MSIYRNGPNLDQLVFKLKFHMKKQKSKESSYKAAKGTQLKESQLLVCLPRQTTCGCCYCYIGSIKVVFY